MTAVKLFGRGGYMKSLVAIFAFVFASSVFAQTTLKIPVYSEDGQPISVLNKRLSARGHRPLPLFLEITQNGDAYAAYEKMSKSVSEAFAKLGEENYMLSEAIPNSEIEGTCYTGIGGKAVVGLVFSLAGGFYTEQMNLWGWRYKNRKGFDANFGDTKETDKILKKESAEWRNWRGDSEDVLLVLAYSDDGDDMNEIIIPKCQ
jgi:hypothetical protein